MSFFKRLIGIFRRFDTACAAALVFSAGMLCAAEYDVKQIADETMVNRAPTVNPDGLAAWTAASRDPEKTERVDIILYRNNTASVLTESQEDAYAFNKDPVFFGDRLFWVSSFRGIPQKALPAPKPDITDTNAPPPKTQYVQDITWDMKSPPPEPLDPALMTDTNISPEAVTNVPVTYTGDAEIMLWNNEATERLTRDNRSDVAPYASDQIVAWQKARGWPFGWEIMMWDGSERFQLTTNYYYDMGPQVDGRRVVWYGWDGNDFEIYLYDHSTRTFEQITNNTYDDIAPTISSELIAWEAYAGAESQIYVRQNGQTRKISINVDDDMHPCAWSNQVVWQGFDGEDFEIYLYNGERTIKLTSNTYDDERPYIRDGVICWIGYEDNWDSEIYVWDGLELTRLTENNYDDRDPRTAGGQVIWFGTEDEKSYIFLAGPK